MTLDPSTLVLPAGHKYNATTRTVTLPADEYDIRIGVYPWHDGSVVTVAIEQYESLFGSIVTQPNLVSTKHQYDAPSRMVIVPTSDYYAMVGLEFIEETGAKPAIMAVKVEEYERVFVNGGMPEKPSKPAPVLPKRGPFTVGRVDGVVGKDRVKPEGFPDDEYIVIWQGERVAGKPAMIALTDAEASALALALFEQVQAR